MKTKHILLTGASGYVGQHLLSHWMTEGPAEPDTRYHILALFHRCPGFSQAVEEATCVDRVQVTTCSCDISQPSWDEELPFQTTWDICIHTAALSSPRACQKDPTRAQAINVPTQLFDKLQQVPLVVLSTDQVYDGKKDVVAQGFYVEATDTPNPINVYGETKLALEEHLATTRTAPTVLLRSSIILGPKATLGGGAHDTFLHFCASLSQETTFFTNEYRTVVAVSHVCRIMDWMIRHLPAAAAAATAAAVQGCQVFHLGGPERVNRYDMAQAVVSLLDSSKHQWLAKAEQTSPTSPLDISMDSSKLEALTGIAHEPATLQGIVEYTFAKESSGT